MREFLNEKDRFAGLEPERRKPSFLVILLIGLLLLLVCSLGYDNLVKPYLANRKQQTEKQVEPTPSETESVAASESNNIIPDETEVEEEKIIEKPVPRTKELTSKQNYPLPAPIQKAEGKKETTESEHLVHPEQPIKNHVSVPSKNEENKNLSVTEILERQTHADVVKQAKRAGVSSEGTTTQILERITHADVVKQAKRAGVSTEGTTTQILERITHADVVKQAKRAGVSTEGTTTQILERITHADVVKQAKRAGVSTEGSTSDILERITKKEMEKYGY